MYGNQHTRVRARRSLHDGYPPLKRPLPPLGTTWTLGWVAQSGGGMSLPSLPHRGVPVAIPLRAPSRVRSNTTTEAGWSLIIVTRPACIELRVNHSCSSRACFRASVALSVMRCRSHWMFVKVQNIMASPRGRRVGTPSPTPRVPVSPYSLAHLCSCSCLVERRASPA
jgi:hypothetical protein